VKITVQAQTSNIAITFSTKSDMLLECFDIHVNDLFIDLFHGFYDRKLSQLVLSIIKIKKVIEFWCT
jgi:hypothetical protein